MPLAFLIVKYPQTLTFSTHSRDSSFLGLLQSFSSAVPCQRSGESALPETPPVSRSKKGGPYAPLARGGLLCLPSDTAAAEATDQGGCCCRAPAGLGNDLAPWEPSPTFAHCTLNSRSDGSGSEALIWSRGLFRTVWAGCPSSTHFRHISKLNYFLCHLSG